MNRVQRQKQQEEQTNGFSSYIQRRGLWCEMEDEGNQRLRATPESQSALRVYSGATHRTIINRQSTL
jgi:hypothetical protein